MKQSAAVLALIGNISAIKIADSPDVWGPNGENYKNKDARYDVALIGINKTKENKSGRICSPGEWATVHYTATLPDGRLVGDSRQEPTGLPKRFIVGASEVFKCWDLGIQKLRSGEEATLACPSYLAWGGAFTQAPLGGEPIPLNTAVNFKLEVESCDRTPAWTQQFAQPRTTTLQPGRCFYLHLDEAEDTHNDLVLSADAEDYSPTWPSRYTFLEHQVYDDLAQQWFFNEKDGSIHNNATPDYFLQNDKGEL